jgi:hypothetical protein
MFPLAREEEKSNELPNLSRPALALIVMMAAFAISSCGDEGGDASRAEFARGADAACALANKRLDLFGEGNPDPDERLQQIRGVSQALDDAVEQLDGLETPGGEDGERAAKLVASLSEEARVVKPVLKLLDRAVRDKDMRAVEEARRRLEGIDEQKSNRLARELGADECAT